MSGMNKIWFITGISRGLGLALAQAVVQQGDTVIGTTRDGRLPLEALQGRLHVLALDVGDKEAIEACIGQAHALYGRLDVIVNNAGYGLLGSIEEATPAETTAVFNINFFGPLQVVKSALPYLRAQRSGHIVNVSSIAGLAPAAGSGLYAAAKFALEGMSQSLALEVAPLGLRVTLVEPGAFRTDFLSPHSIRISDVQLPDYAATAGKSVAHLNDIAGKQLGDPVKGAAAIVAAVTAESPPLHMLLGSDALGRAREKLRLINEELDRWEAVSRSTDHAA
jgi:NAD(P)-dependent dehydrogenase (short-subunit alcohol dehydrogenase family)